MYDFVQARERFMDVLGVTTQVGIAEKLGVRQTSVHSAWKKQSIPARWLVSLLRSHGINPLWVLEGEPNKKFLVPSDSPQEAV